MRELLAEAELAAWINENPGGWIITASPTRARLHAATCRFAGPRPDRGGAARRSMTPRFALSDISEWRDDTDGVDELWPCESCLPTAGPPADGGLIFNVSQLCAALRCENLEELHGAIVDDPGFDREVYFHAVDEDLREVDERTDSANLMIVVIETAGGGTGCEAAFPLTVDEFYREVSDQIARVDAMEVNADSPTT